MKDVPKVVIVILTSTSNLCCAKIRRPPVGTMPGTPHGDSQIDMIIFRSPLVHILSLARKLSREDWDDVFGCPVVGLHLAWLGGAPLLRSQFMECKYDFWGNMAVAGTDFPTRPGGHTT